MCSAWRSSLWRWDAAARKGPCEGHKGLADETGERVRFCGALLLDAVGTCCAARVALLWCEPRFPDACAAGAEAIGAAREPGARALGRAGVVRPLSMRRCNGAPAMRGVLSCGGRSPDGCDSVLYTPYISFFLPEVRELDAA